MADGTGTRVTRSLRRRLASMESDSGTSSRPSTPAVSQLSSISEKEDSDQGKVPAGSRMSVVTISPEANCGTPENSTPRKRRGRKSVPAKPNESTPYPTQRRASQTAVLTPSRTSARKASNGGAGIRRVTRSQSISPDEGQTRREKVNNGLSQLFSDDEVIVIDDSDSILRKPEEKTVDTHKSDSAKAEVESITTVSLTSENETIAEGIVDKTSNQKQQHQESKITTPNVTPINTPRADGSMSNVSNRTPSSDSRRPVLTPRNSLGETVVSPANAGSIQKGRSSSFTVVAEMSPKADISNGQCTSKQNENINISFEGKRRSTSAKKSKEKRDSLTAGSGGGGGGGKVVVRLTDIASTKRRESSLSTPEKGEGKEESVTNDADNGDKIKEKMEMTPKSTSATPTMDDHHSTTDTNDQNLNPLCENSNKSQNLDVISIQSESECDEERPQQPQPQRSQAIIIIDLRSSDDRYEISSQDECSQEASITSVTSFDAVTNMNNENEPLSNDVVNNDENQSEQQESAEQDKEKTSNESVQIKVEKMEECDTSVPEADVSLTIAPLKWVDEEVFENVNEQNGTKKLDVIGELTPSLPAPEASENKSNNGDDAAKDSETSLGAVEDDQTSDSIRLDVSENESKGEENGGDDEKGEDAPEEETAVEDEEENEEEESEEQDSSKNEEENNSENDNFLDVEAKCIKDYVSGDSMLSEEREEYKLNELPEYGESIGSTSSRSSEVSDENSYEDSFICDDEEKEDDSKENSLMSEESHKEIPHNDSKSSAEECEEDDNEGKDENEEDNGEEEEEKEAMIVDQEEEEEEEGVKKAAAAMDETVRESPKLFNTHTIEASNEDIQPGNKETVQLLDELNADKNIDTNKGREKESENEEDREEIQSKVDDTEVTHLMSNQQEHCQDQIVVVADPLKSDADMQETPVAEGEDGNESSNSSCDHLKEPSENNSSSTTIRSTTDEQEDCIDKKETVPSNENLAEEEGEGHEEEVEAVEEAEGEGYEEVEAVEEEEGHEEEVEAEEEEHEQEVEAEEEEHDQEVEAEEEEHDQEVEAEEEHDQEVEAEEEREQEVVAEEKEEEKGEEEGSVALDTEPPVHSISEDIRNGSAGADSMSSEASSVSIHRCVKRKRFISDSSTSDENSSLAFHVKKFKVSDKNETEWASTSTASSCAASLANTDSLLSKQSPPQIDLILAKCHDILEKRFQSHKMDNSKKPQTSQKNRRNRRRKQQKKKTRMEFEHDTKGERAATASTSGNNSTNVEEEASKDGKGKLVEKTLETEKLATLAKKSVRSNSTSAEEEKEHAISQKRPKDNRKQLNIKKAERESVTSRRFPEELLQFIKKKPVQQAKPKTQKDNTQGGGKVIETALGELIEMPVSPTYKPCKTIQLSTGIMREEPVSPNSLQRSGQQIFYRTTAGLGRELPITEGSSTSSDNVRKRKRSSAQDDTPKRPCKIRALEEASTSKPRYDALLTRQLGNHGSTKFSVTDASGATTAYDMASNARPVTFKERMQNRKEIPRKQAKAVQSQRQKKWR